MCGSAQINEHVFCEGLKKLGLLQDYKQGLAQLPFLSRVRFFDLNMILIHEEISLLGSLLACTAVMMY